MQAGEGFVLIEIPPEINSVKTGSGIEFYVDTSYDKPRFSNVHAKVVSVPHKIKSKSAFASKGKRGTFSPDDDMRLQPADEVYFHFHSLTNAKKRYDRGSYFEEDGKRFALLPYASLFFAVRKNKEPELKGGIDTAPYYASMDRYEKWKKNPEQFIMLNNWLLIEPISINQHKEHFEGYGAVVIDDEKTKGKIVLLSETGFKSSEGVVRACPAGIGVEPGETIIFERESDVPVEYDLCRSLEKPYWRMELKDIIAKRVPGGIELLQDYCLVLQDDEVKSTQFDIWPQVPSTGEVVMVSPKVTKVAVGQHVFFVESPFTNFPLRDGRMGILVHEGAMLMETCGQKIVRL